MRSVILTIASMTGFARASGELQTDLSNISWLFEVKSVNGKALDIKTKLPQTLEDLAFEFRRIAAQYLQRGSVSVYLELKRTALSSTMQVNTQLLQELTQKALEIYRANPNEIDKPQSTDLLRLPGVLEVSAPSEEDEQALRQKLLAEFEALCRRLQEDRKIEGAKIKEALIAILQKIGSVAAKVEKIAEEQPAKIKEKLENQIKQWVNPAEVSEERLAQEVVFYITRADIREEVDRLKAHVKTAEQLLESSEAVGRRLDFLCQELNREANTTCSKSSDAELTALGMELKALIEQFREQVQNIE